MSEEKKTRPEIVMMRGKGIVLLAETGIPPRVFFHPDTPKKVVWLDPN